MSIDVELQTQVEDHLEACWEVFYREDGDDTLSPAVQPFCGCRTCEVREMLYVAVPIIRDAVLAGEL